MTDIQPEALIRAKELEQIGAESSLARAMAAHTIRLLYKENEALRARLTQPEPYAAQAAMVAQQTQGRMYVDPVTGDVGIGTVKWDASAPLVVHPHPAFQATPPQEWKGLSTAEVKVLWNLTKKPSEFAKIIETKLKEKNHGCQDD